MKLHSFFVFFGRKKYSIQPKHNTMKTVKLLVIACVATCIAMSANAQNGRLSIGAELGLPMGDFGDLANMGFGGTLRYEYPMGDNVGLTVTAGYLTFSGKEFEILPGTSLKYSTNMIPVQAGVKYYFTDQQEGLYGMAEIGIHNSKADVEGAESTTDLSYAPEVGYHLENFDLGLRYQFIATEGSTTSYLGLRIAYVLGEK